MISIYHHCVTEESTQALLECMKVRTAAADNSALQLTKIDHEDRFNPDRFDDERAVHIVFRIDEKVAVYARLYPTYMITPEAGEGTNSSAFELQKFCVAHNEGWSPEQRQALTRGVRAVLSKALKFAVLNQQRALELNFGPGQMNLAKKLGLAHKAQLSPTGTVSVSIPSSTTVVAKVHGLRLASSRPACSSRLNGPIRLSNSQRPKFLVNQ